MKFLLFLFFLSPGPLFAQTDTLGLPTVDGKIKFVDIVEIPNRSKSDLFTSAQSWLAQTFKKEMITTNVSDPINSLVSGEMTLGTLRNPKYKLTYTLTCRDNKYKLEIENIYGFLDLSSMTGKSGSWIPVQRAYDSYIERKAKGKSVASMEKSYVNLREHVSSEIIRPLRLALNKPSDF